MRSGPPLWLLLTGLLAACGGDEDASHYERFTLELIDRVEGAKVLPGTALAYRTQYVGDLARNLRYTAHFTHEASGETASFEWGDLIQDTARIDSRGSWLLRHEFLEKSGRIRVQLQASLTSTRNGSKPWVVSSQSIYVELYPQLERLEVRPLVPGQPVAYGTPLELRVTGKDLWGDVALTVLDVETGARVAELDRTLKFDGSQLTLASTSPLRARVLERIGTHPLRSMPPDCTRKS
jgi:hypothetical protein